MTELNIIRHLNAIGTFEAEQDGKTVYLSAAHIADLSLVDYAAELDPTARAEFLLTFAKNLPFIRSGAPTEHKYVRLNSAIFAKMIRRKAAFTPEMIADLFEALVETRYKSGNPPQAFKLSIMNWRVGLIVNQLAKALKAYDLSADVRRRLEAIADSDRLEPGWHHSQPDIGKARTKLRALIKEESGESLYYPLCGRTIETTIKMDLAGMEESQAQKWHTFLHAAKKAAKTARPSGKTQKTLNDHIEAIGSSEFRSKMWDWMAVASSKDGFDKYVLWPDTSQLLKGMVWGLVRFHDEATLNALAKLTETSFKTIPDRGPGAPALGNACIYVLGQSKGLGGAAQLSRLKLKIKQRNAQKLIQSYIDENAQARGMVAGELEEMAVPDFGLTLGVKSVPFKEYELRLEVLSAGQASLTWYKPDGTIQKTTPSIVKDSKPLADKLKHLRDQVKNIRKASTAQRERIDRLYTDDRVWAPEPFKAYYLNHGLVGPIARQLIWTLTIGDTNLTGLFHDGGWQDVTGQPIQGEPSAYRLWHPIGATTDDILAWRARIEALEISQPFKQAYREVYLLTDAERDTRVYSNRMATHILKQHQFNTLAAIRGWKYQLMGAYDDGRDTVVASKKLPAYGLVAEYWIDAFNQYDAFNDAGIWDFVTTDQIRFKNDADDMVDLVQIPDLVLSEVMRDTDMFVGVASIGNDPTLQGRGGGPRLQDYWQTYSFGALTETARTRQTVLENLLPRLKIREVTEISGKFLQVKGKLNSYKIHIGSTNILIQPDDRYLCIVPGRGKDKKLDRLYLPFEGDRGLSVLLSKAFMLAEDDKITDKTIISQLARR